MLIEETLLSLKVFQSYKGRAIKNRTVKISFRDNLEIYNYSARFKLAIGFERKSIMFSY